MTDIKFALHWANSIRPYYINFYFNLMSHFYDTLLGEYIKNPGIRGLGLDKLSAKEFNYKMISYDEITNKGKINFKDVDLKEASIYSGEDVYITHKIYEKQRQDGITNKKILQEIEIPLLQVLKDMEINGVKINRDKLKEIGILLENEIRRLEKHIYELAGTEFNINSPKQVGEILFEKLNLQKGKKTKTGYSVNAEVLEELAFSNEIAKEIVNYRHYAKLLSTYIEGLQDLLDENDLLHTSYNQAITATGRLSSANPNLQNIPIGAGVAGEIRGAFVSRFENGKICAIDYSQVEVRILAILSRDENLLEAFKNGEDIHQKTAEFIFGYNKTKNEVVSFSGGSEAKEPGINKNVKNNLNDSASSAEGHGSAGQQVSNKENINGFGHSSEGHTITPEQRKIAKAVNFGVIYGISGFGLSKMIGISIKDAKEYIDKFFISYPKVRIFLDKIIKDCEETGYVETIFGRRRYISGINDRNRMIKQATEREATNMPIQGTSADIIKLAMIKINDFLKKGNLKSKMIMQVHDELVFDIFPGEEEIISREAKKIMESMLIDKAIVLKADVGVGKNWKEAK